MGLTMTEKILARTAGRESTSPGEILVCTADRAVVLDMQFSSTAVPWRQPLNMAHPDRLAVILDHGAPAPSTRDADGHHMAREFCNRFGIEDFFDIGNHGICHQVIAERGLARPGELLLCSDSHTCAGGAFNTAARGVGGLEMIQIICTGTTWFVVAPSIRVELTGTLSEACEGKDVFLALAGRHGSAGNRNLEFVGSGVSTLSLHDRRTIATQCAEVNAEFSIFAADPVIDDYLAERGVAETTPVEADPDATYDEIWPLELDSFEPQVATPGQNPRERDPRLGATIRGARSVFHRFVRERASRGLRDRGQPPQRKNHRSGHAADRDAVIAAGVSRRSSRRLRRNDHGSWRCRDQLDLRCVLRVPHGGSRQWRGLPDSLDPQLQGSYGKPKLRGLHGVYSHGCRLRRCRSNYRLAGARLT